MKFEILTDNFKKALSGSEKVTRKILTLPVLQNVLLKAEGNFLQLTTTNLETTIQWWVLAKIEKPGTSVVPATFLSNLIGLVKSEKIQIIEQNKSLSITAENQSFQVQGYDPEDFPLIPKIEKAKKYQIQCSVLARGLAQVIDIPNISQIRPEISGVYFSIQKDKLKIVATDSFRLGEKTLSLGEKTEDELHFIIPQASSRELLNIAMSEEGSVNIILNPNQVLFEFFDQELSHSKIHILSRIIEGEYPNYKEIIPKKYSTSIQLDRAEFENQIKKAGLFPGKVLEVKLEVFPGEGKIRIFSQSADIGKNESFMAAKVSGEKVEVSFNYKFLLDGLSDIKSSEVSLELSTNNGPGALRPVGDSSFLYILMPVKNN